MRLKTVVLAALIAILASAVLAQGFEFPGRMFPETGLRPWPSQGLAGLDDVMPFKGMTSVDYLGKLRRDFSMPGLSSAFPGTWRNAINAPDTAEYLGFTYKRSSGAPPAGGAYYTGEQHGGRKVYAAGGGRPVPDAIYLMDDGKYIEYSIADRPPVYAYVRSGAFNVNETVTFGIMNDRGGRIELRNAAPFVIQRRDGNTWATAFAPVAAQVIVPLESGASKEWHWDQASDEGTIAAGDYRVLIEGRYAAPFRIGSDVPAVERSEAGYDRASLEKAVSSPKFLAFARGYQSQLGREDTISQMQFKAAGLGLDPGKLRAAIDAASDRTPCLAVHVTVDGSPTWIIAFCGGQGGPAVFAVGEAGAQAPYRGRPAGR
jgi:hypothetical protein